MPRAMSASRIARAWLSTRAAMRHSPQALARRREHLWQALQPSLRKTPALASFTGMPLAHFPIIDVSAIRANYGDWNSLGYSHDQLHAAAAAAETKGDGEVAPGLVAGYSTGTSGARGLFVASQAERADYIGQSLARLLPLGTLFRRVRLALMLRANSRLYSDVGGGHFAFAHFPLDGPIGETRAALARFSPTILIAPSHRLVDLAGEVLAGRLAVPALGHIFFGAEPMGASERTWVEHALGARPDPIYQATEGFIGGACQYGKLHLNEHSLSIELEAVEGTSGFRPILTDLRRFTQPIVRVRTDDFLEPDPAPCLCGYAGRVVRPVMGRVTDIWRFDNLCLTPAQVVDTIDSALGCPAPWQAIASPRRVELRVGSSVDPERARRAVILLRAALRIPVPVVLGDIQPERPSPKRRQVRWVEARDA